jgi:phage-related protein (TIGR01555 family)
MSKKPVARKVSKPKAKKRKPVAVKADNVVKLAVDNSATQRLSQSRAFELLAKSRGRKAATTIALDPFKPYKPMPGVVPQSRTQKDGFPIAMDEVIRVSEWAAANLITGQFSQGSTFIGYPLLSQLAQLAEYRKITETIATHMTRKFIKLQSKHDEDDKSEQLKMLGDAIENFKVRDIFRQAAITNGFFGRAHLYLDNGQTDPEELKLSIGNGRNAMSKAKARGKAAIQRLRIVEPMWTYPASYNSSDPLTENWYNPETWFVQGKELHNTRLIPMVGYEVPDMLKPAYSFGGLSMSQMAMPYIDNWLRTRQSVADTLWSFSVNGFKTDLSAMMAPGAQFDLFDRAELFNNLRNNRGLMMLNKDTEEYFQFNTPLGTMDMLQAQSQEQMASVSNIPLVFLLGISPHGLNASSEGEIRAFYDFIHAYQMKFFTEPLTRVIDFIQLALFGKVDPDITFIFEPLWSLDEKGSAEVRKLEAETDDLHINAGVISPLEARKRVANDPEELYDGLDVDDLPEPPAEQLGGAGLDPGEPHAQPGVEGEPQPQPSPSPAKQE